VRRGERFGDAVVAIPSADFAELGGVVALGGPLPAPRGIVAAATPTSDLTDENRAPSCGCWLADADALVAASAPRMVAMPCRCGHANSVVGEGPHHTVAACTATAERERKAAATACMVPRIPRLVNVL
jgi:hypothetical protein